MKCQHCGNELAPDEVFCGQCGNPNATPIQPTEMMQTPSSRDGILNDGNGGTAFSQEQRPAYNQTGTRQGPQQRSGFYQDATEALTRAPNAYYPQQSDAGIDGGYYGPGQFGTQVQQPFMSGNYPAQATYPPQQFGSGYGGRPGSVTPPPTKRNNGALVVGVVCLIIAMLVVGTFGTLYFLRNSSAPQSTPTVVAQASPTAALSPTPSPTPSPSPTVAPTATPAPDPNFSWCGTQCTQSGYQIEYPNGWTPGSAQNAPGTQFSTTSAVDTVYAAVKTPSTTATSASDLLSADIATFSGQTNFQGPQSILSTTIGGENWSYSTITYQLSGHTEQVNVYATIHQNKGYVIELQASQDQFSTINTQYFRPMLASFQFVTPTPSS